MKVAQGRERAKVRVVGGAVQQQPWEGKKNRRPGTGKLFSECGKGQARSKKQEARSNQKASKKVKKAYDTRASRVLSHLSTVRAHRCLTPQIGRDTVCSPGYGRRQRLVPPAAPCTPKTDKMVGGRQQWAAEEAISKVRQRGKSCTGLGF